MERETELPHHAVFEDDVALSLAVSEAVGTRSLRRPTLRNAIVAAVKRAKADQLPPQAVLVGLKAYLREHVMPAVTPAEWDEFAQHAVRWTIGEYQREDAGRAASE